MAFHNVVTVTNSHSFSLGIKKLKELIPIPAFVFGFVCDFDGYNLPLIVNIKPFVNTSKCPFS